MCTVSIVPIEMTLYAFIIHTDLRTGCSLRMHDTAHASRIQVLFMLFIVNAA